MNREAVRMEHVLEESSDDYYMPVVTSQLPKINKSNYLTD
jgi:hypothetical protein